MPLRFSSRFAAWLLAAMWWCVIASPHARADETMRQVQEELRRRNLYFGDIDGCKTLQLSAALRSYQQRKGFTLTGEPDDTTLRSLNLLPALALTPAESNSSSPTPPPGPTVAHYWPDITVLRSDAARRAPMRPVANTDAEPVTPTPGPPPAAASVHFTPEAMQTFIESYLHAGQTNDTDTEMDFYADHVDYFGEGVVDRRFIRADVEHYDHRWPERQFTLLGAPTLADPPAGSPGEVAVRFRFAFTNKRPHYTVEGKVDDVFTLIRTGPESLRIVSMKEQRVREK